MKYGGDLKSIVLDAMDRKPGVPRYKDYFIGVFVQKIRKYPLHFTLDNAHINLLWKKEPDYYRVLFEFYEEIYPFWRSGTITTDIYNQIMSLSVFITDIARFLFETKQEIIEFKTSHKFLKYLSKENKVPLVFYPRLALMLVTDEIDFKFVKMKPQEKEKVITQYDYLKEITNASFMFLRKYAEIIEDEMDDFFFKGEAKDDDVYFSKDGKTRSINFFDPEPKSIIILGNRGVGKTIGTIRIIISALEQGFTIIVFADPRGEFRYIAHPLKTSGKPGDSNRYMWDRMKEQGLKPKGYPVTFYTERPSHTNDKDISEFDGKEDEWESLSGIVVFRGTKIPIDVVEGVGKNIYLKHANHVARVMRTFEIWREKNQEKKILIVLNEAQDFVGSEADKTEWELHHAGTRLVTNVRGYNCPVVLNTQFLSRLRTPARQFDVLFTSMITLEKERKLIANTFGRREVKNILAPTKEGSFLLEKHIFYKFEKGRYEQVKFLAVPCMIRGTLPS